MKTFKYRALTQKGEISQGYTQADSELSVLHFLGQQGVEAVDIREKKRRPSRRHRTLPDTQLTLLFKQLTLLLRGGLPLDQALQDLKVAAGKKLAALLEGIQADIQNGLSLSLALGKTNQFPPLAIHLIQMGEQHGKLDLACEDICHILGKEYEQKKQIQSALAYPILILLSSLCSLGFLIFFLLPTFANIFQELSVPLPKSTELLLKLAHWGNAHPIFLLLILLGTVFMLCRLWPTLLRTFLLKLPGIRALVRSHQTAYLTLLLAHLLAGGIPLVRALNLICQVNLLPSYQQALVRIKHQVEQGERIGTCFMQAAIFPPLVGSMVQAGEKSGTLPQVLKELYQHFEQEFAGQTKILISLLEPTITLGVGILVGLIVFSLFTPLFSITQTLIE